MTVKSDVLRRYIIDEVEAHPRDIARVVAERFGISRQAVVRHLRILIEDGVLAVTGKTSDRVYSLVVAKKIVSLPLADNRQEHVVWEEHVAPMIAGNLETVINICYYGFTEIFNNAIDHSGGTLALVKVETSAKEITIHVHDDGVGIFEKIRSRFGLNDHREAVLELSKGKLTTDEAHHSGQGIFFTSRMFDDFAILADNHFFTHRKFGEHDDDWLVETRTITAPGTSVFMTIPTNSETVAKKVFDKYSDIQDDYAFSKTHVPLSLAKYAGEQLVSRSQAKRVLSRFDNFKEVFLDFHGVDSIGQAFADEIFRVFRRSRPDIGFVVINANDEILQMISRAESIHSVPSSPPLPGATSDR